MSTFNWPSEVATPVEFDLSLKQVSYRAVSMFGFKGQTTDLVNERWVATLSVSVRNTEDAAQLEAFVNRLRKGTHSVWLSHYRRPVPEGTAQSSTGLLVSALRGANSVQIGVGAGQTLLTGDVLGIDDQLLQVAEDCTADGSGVLVVPLVNRLKRAVSGMVTPVVLNSPLGKFQMTSNSGVMYGRGGIMQGASYEFVESPADSGISYQDPFTP